MLRNDLHGRAVEGRRHLQEFGEDAAHRVEVRRWTDTQRTALLGAHVGGSAGHRVGARQRRSSVVGGVHVRQSEVDDFGVATTLAVVRQEDILGLQIPVHDSERVRGLQRVEHVAHDGNDFRAAAAVPDARRSN